MNISDDGMATAEPDGFLRRNAFATVRGERNQWFMRHQFLLKAVLLCFIEDIGFSSQAIRKLLKSRPYFD